MSVSIFGVPGTSAAKTGDLEKLFRHLGISGKPPGPLNYELLVQRYEPSDLTWYAVYRHDMLYGVPKTNGDTPHDANIRSGLLGMNGGNHRATFWQLISDGQFNVLRVFLSAFTEFSARAPPGEVHRDLEIFGARVFAMNRTLTTVDLSFCNVGDNGAIVLAQSKTMRHLKLYCDNIGDAGAVALAENPVLVELVLSHNNLIGNRGITALSQSQSLTTLNLAHAEVGDAGAAILANSRNLRTLSLESDDITDDGAAALARNPTLTSLDLNMNRIGPAGAAAFAVNDTLRHLYLNGNAGVGLAAINNLRRLVNFEITYDW